MRYARSHDLFFLHIPKCAGLSLGRALGDIAAYPTAEVASDLGIGRAEAARLLDGRGFRHETLGPIDPAHLPLEVLRGHFPATWRLFSGATGVAMVRDPRTRFVSAVMQRLAEFKGARGLRLGDPAVRDEAARVCDWLDGRGVFCDLEHVHFTRQVDYVSLDGVQLVRHVFPIERPAALLAWLADAHGIILDLSIHHDRRQPRAWFRPVQPVVRYATRRLLPEALRQALYPYWIGSGLFAAAAPGYAGLALGADVEGFVRSYYAEDAMLHRAASAAAAGAEAAGRIAA